MFTKHSKQFESSDDKSKKKGISPSKEVSEEFVKKTPAKKRSLFMKKKK